MYVYYPAVGWCWVVAPWLWGFGPMPFFGIYGPWHFGWYGHGYGHWYGFAGHYGNAGWGGRGYWHGGQWHGYNRVSSGHPASPHQGGYWRIFSVWVPGHLLDIVLLRPMADPPVEEATVATVDMGDRCYPFTTRQLKLE